MAQDFPGKSHSLQKIPKGTSTRLSSLYLSQELVKVGLKVTKTATKVTFIKTKGIHFTG